DVSLGVRNGASHLVELVFGLFGQEILIETKMNGGLADDLVVIEIADGISQHINPVNGVVGKGLGLRSRLSGSLRLLIGGCSAGINVLNTGLGAGIDVFDRLGILGSQIIELIGFVDNRSGLFFNILLAGAADRCGHARHQD